MYELWSMLSSWVIRKPMISKPEWPNQKSNNLFPHWVGICWKSIQTKKLFPPLDWIYKDLCYFSDSCSLAADRPILLMERFCLADPHVKYRIKGSKTVFFFFERKVVKLLDVQREKINGINSLLLNDVNFTSRTFCRRPSYSEENGRIYFNWTGIVSAIAAWEDYELMLSKKIHLQLPYWRMQDSLYNVQIDA